MIFYRGPCVRITHEVFERHCPTHQVFLIRRLRHVHVVQRAAPAPTRAALRPGSASLAGAGAVLAAIAVRDLDPPATPLLAIALLAVASLASVACCRVQAVVYELHAVYGDRWEILYRTTDLREFGQVKRALTRALEAVADGW